MAAIESINTNTDAEMSASVMSPTNVVGVSVSNDMNPLFTPGTTPIFYGSLCKQMDKRQDLAVHGKYNDGYYIGAFDGHGTNACINILRGLDYSVIAQDPLKIVEHTSG